MSLKPHLSWSQIDCWLKSKAQYIERYFEGKKIFETKELKFGKSTAELAEIGIGDFPMLDNSEYKLEGYIGGVPMLGYLDTASDCLTRFKEFKTGKTEWTQEKANSHGQLYIYAILLEQETGYIPECELIWRKTENRSDGTIGFTDDEPKIFPIEWDEHRMKHWRKEVPRIWTEIQEAHKAWEADEGKEYDDACLIEYAEYQRKIKELQSKAESLKPFISALLDQKGSKITTKDGSWYYTEKKIYEYPEEILRAEAIVDKAKDEFKKTAEAKISKSLTFRLG